MSVRSLNYFSSLRHCFYFSPAAKLPASISSLISLHPPPVFPSHRLHSRSGTLPHFLCVGFGQACAVAQQELPHDAAWVSFLSQRLRDGINAKIPDVTLNGDADAR